MSELTIQWRPKEGAESSINVPASKGAVVASSKLPGAFADTFPLVVASEQGWVVSLSRDVKFKLYAGGKEVPVNDHAKAATFTDKSSGKEIALVRFAVGGAIDEARVVTPGGSLWLKTAPAAETTAAPPAAQTQPPATGASAAPPAQPVAPAGGGASAAKPPQAPKPGGSPAPGTSGGKGGSDAVASAAAASASSEEHNRRDRAYWIILLLALSFHIGLMVVLGGRHVPDDMYAEAQEMPERFAKLIVPKEPEPVEEEAAGGGDEQPQEQQEQPEEDPGEADGGGDQQQESTSRSKEEIREKVRTKGILAVFASKREGGGALSDVLSEGGIASGLDSALGDVGGVVVAQRGMDVRGPRGAGGGKSADIGDLEAGSGRGVGLGSKSTRKVEAGVQTASFVSQGSLSADAIRQVVQQNLRGVKYCYEKELAKNPELQGKVVVKFTIGPDGKLSKYEIESTTLNNAEAESCILQRMRRWRFPQPDNGSVTVSYPFIFTATG